MLEWYPDGLIQTCAGVTKSAATQTLIWRNHYNTIGISGKLNLVEWCPRQSVQLMEHRNIFPNYLLASSPC